MLHKLLTQVLIPYFIYPLLRLLFKSCRIHFSNLNELNHFLNHQNPQILALWHDQLLMVPHLFAGPLQSKHFAAVISNSRDGQILCDIAKKLGNTQCIRVSHDKKHASLKEMLKALERGDVICITPDGPTGPWRKAKQGVLAVSSYGNAEIVVLGWKAKRGIRIPSKDKMFIPLPFTEIEVKLKRVNQEEIKRRTLRESCTYLTERLNSVTEA